LSDLPPEIEEKLRELGALEPEEVGPSPVEEALATIQLEEQWLQVQETCVESLERDITNLLTKGGEAFFTEAKKAAFRILSKLPPLSKPHLALLAAGREVEVEEDPTEDIRLAIEEFKERWRDLIEDIRTQQSLIETGYGHYAEPEDEFRASVVERLMRLATDACWLRALVLQSRQDKREYMKHRETMHESEPAPWEARGK